MARQWLVDIPAEIRLEVYRHYFGAPNIALQRHSHDECSNGLPFIDLTDRSTFQSLLSTCKAIRAEALPLLSEKATFVAINCKCYKFDKIVPNMPQHIQNLLIGDTGGYQPSVDIFAFTHRPIAHNLRSLTVASLNWSNVMKCKLLNPSWLRRGLT